MSIFNQRKARPEHIAAFLKAIKKDEIITPYEIVKRSGLSLTAVQGVISEFENQNKIEVIRQNKTPRLQIRLK